MEDKTKKKAIWAWTMYDWGNSAFATTIMAAVLPVYYSSVAGSTLAPNIATARWGFTHILCGAAGCNSRSNSWINSGFQGE